MTPQGNWVKATSDYGQGLTGQGRLFYDQHYDSSGAYVGSEGFSYDSSGWEMTPAGTYTGAHTSDLGHLSLPGGGSGFSFTPASERTDTVSQAQRDAISGTSFFD